MMTSPLLEYILININKKQLEVDILNSIDINELLTRLDEASAQMILGALINV